ncbi:protein translocase subunit secY/sec61 alpha [Scopulibacillus darangshiensis]|uniref:Protein translocase subunit SecY n=1 Tax=Scopulibacillus darangshiensis TaxID=442528 RepID=A0A4R2NR53_9BACL|nr:preprotein translocase subunit SecY [Scopulibacillus darangshiensis]TCP24182.1 protein translocase subunit secY/sec61 alpha [Scopulibacillus darangshiensis]
MFAMISNIWRVGDIRRKVIFTLLMLVVFRIGTFIPVPNINSDLIKFNNSSVFGFLNTFGGGALQNFSILSMGIMPYITASIIMQLLQMDVVPKFTEWSKQGEMGRKKISQVTRYGTVVLGFIQAIGLAYGFNARFQGLVENPTVWTFLLIAVILTAGTAFLMWLGEQITANGIGNGISIIIFAGIVARIPNAVNQIYAQRFENSDNMFLQIITVLVILLVILVIVVGTIFVQQGMRKIPIQYAKRTVGRKTYGGESTHLPIKVNAAGVIPVIFAISLMITPPTIARFFPSNAVTNWIIRTFDYTTVAGMVIYAALIIAFSYFYTFVQVNPEKMAENLQKQGGYIPGIRPGKNTEKYITRILYRLTLIGSIFLAVIAILPMLFVDIAKLPASVKIGGTSLLIVVGVALDTMKRIEGQLVKRHYKGFIKR